MNGVLIINKPKGYTSRDVVNVVSKKLKVKKVGHTGTLDPIATGVLVICVGYATKLVEELTCSDKDYVATIKLGLETDTLDDTGTILKDESVYKTKSEILSILKKFNCEYYQEVPAYSAVKINGKKLYEYARENVRVKLPTRKVKISNLELIDDLNYIENKIIFKIKCTVSKGTYIRSLIRDIAYSLNTVGIMTDLVRTRQGNFKLEDCFCLENLPDKLLDIVDILPYKKIELTDDNEKLILNGNKIDNVYDSDEVLFIKNSEALALYKSDGCKLKPYKMFK